MMTGALIAVRFQVRQGGNMNIDVTIRGPTGQVIYSLVDKEEGSFTFTAPDDGSNSVCFVNGPHGQPRSVSFSLLDATKTHGQSELAKQDQLTPLEESILALSNEVNSIKLDQEYLKAREKVHRDTTESTNQRVLWWSIFEMFLLIGIGVWQIWSLKRFFEVKRQI